MTEGIAYLTTQTKLRFSIERSLTVIALRAVRAVNLPHLFRPCAVRGVLKLECVSDG